MTVTDKNGSADYSLLELFKTELETGARLLESGLVALSDDYMPGEIEPLMRAAHSIKGAARIVGLDNAVTLAHGMENVLSSAQSGNIRLSGDKIDALLGCNDFFLRLSKMQVSAMADMLGGAEEEIGELCRRLEETVSPGQPEMKELKKDENGTVVRDKPTEIPGQVFPDESMLDLFRIEVENHSHVLETGLVEIEKDQSPDKIEPLMRAAHSLKGAARIVNLNLEVSLAHAMEDVLSAAQHGNLILNSGHIDLLLRSTDIFIRMSSHDPAELHAALSEQSHTVKTLTRSLIDVLAGKAFESSLQEAMQQTTVKVERRKQEPREDRFVRVLSENLSRILGLAGECLVRAKSSKKFSTSLLGMKQVQMEMDSEAENLSMLIQTGSDIETMLAHAEKLSGYIDRYRESLHQHIEDYELYSRRIENLTNRLYSEVVDSRMTPFSDGLMGFPRMVRDLSKKLGKKIDFEVRGGSTPIDRDILEKLESPLTHILRNAVDHGIESPRDRLSAGKEDEGSLVVEARHMYGMLNIIIKDDGRGINTESIRKKVVRNGHTTDAIAADLSDDELYEFLLLPGFTTHDEVTEVSGRGVGLDVVASMLHSVGGTMRIESRVGEGTAFHLQLPITLSIVRTLLLDIGGELYALSLTRIEHALEIGAKQLKTVEGRQFCVYDGENIGVVHARQILKLPPVDTPPESFFILIISDRLDRYGLVVDRFLGQSELVVRPLDPRLGKIPTISACAMLEDGSPVLIMDADDVVRGIDDLISQGNLDTMVTAGKDAHHRMKRILVVDDSITVREVERKILENRGYQVTTALDGMDAWNILLKQDMFDLIISDIDMPRMNGFELVEKTKQDKNLKEIPIIIISYKDREEDKIQGLEAGADYYLTKSSFHDDSLLGAVRDLIGES
ncbi:MAG: hybrid sensor histidine kinase/response regulator [Candidatus Latescibacteria bacterium]|nr:hybrid sensor histidine kinase/response regulator [Candidatus Latescibacterota bacterium]